MHPATKAARVWLRKHSYWAALLAVLSVVLISLPQWASSAWALFSSKPLIPSLIEKLSALQLHFSLYWITTPLGLVILATILYLMVTGKRALANEGTSEAVNAAELDVAKEGITDMSICPDQWLHNIAQYDKNATHAVVRVIDCQLLESKNDQVAEVVFRFEILNSSVFPVTIDDQFTGWIYFDKTPLYSERVIQDNMARNLAHANSGYFEICQRLSQSEVDLINKANSLKHFRFNVLKVMIKGGKGEGEGRNFEGIVTPRKLEIPWTLRKSGERCRA